MMQLLNKKFKKYKNKYILQCLFATLSVFVILLFLEARAHTVLIAVLGSSAFLVFTMPRKERSKPRYLIGGYVMGMIAGVGCHWFSSAFAPSVLGEVVFYAILGALSVGSSTFLMVVTNTEHPPAAGLALGLILNDWTVMTLVIVMAGIISLALIRTFFKKMMINLL